MRFNSQLILILVYLLCLTGCSSIPLSSMYQLSKLDILTTDPELITIAIRTHDAFSLQEGDVLYRMGYHADDLKLDEEFIVKPTHIAISNTVIAQTLPDQHIIRLLLTSADAERMRQLQKSIASHKTGGGAGKGYMSIALVGICRQGEIPEGQLTADTFIKTQETSQFIPLVQSFNLRGSHQGWNNDIASWPLCHP